MRLLRAVVVTTEIIAIVSALSACRFLPFKPQLPPPNGTPIAAVVIANLSLG